MKTEHATQCLLGKLLLFNAEKMTEMCKDEMACISTKHGTFRMKKSEIRPEVLICNSSWYCNAPKDKHEDNCIFNSNFKRYIEVDEK